MNTSDPRDERDAASPRLPELSDQRVDAIENALFTDIANERVSTRKHRTRRTRIWSGIGAAAAIVAVAAVISPMVLNTINGAGAGGSTAVSDSEVARDFAPAPAAQSADGANEASVTSEDMDFTDGGAGGDVGAITPTNKREVIATGSATVTVDKIPEALSEISDAVTAAGGFVESMSTDEADTATPEGEAADSYDTSMPYYPSGNWITVRVPADKLTDVIDELSDIGKVNASSITRQDVTDQAIDVRARIEALQASVDRMQELLDQAGNLTDLISAENALTERQANLESYQQQLKYLEDQVAMSSLTVMVTRHYEPVAANPAGFGDGLAAGWNGLVATLNGIVISLGFLIPWIVVIGLLALIVWAIVRLVRGRRRNSAAPEATTER